MNHLEDYQIPYGVIGIIIEIYNDHLRIQDIINNSPGWLAGLQINDIIKSVDGISTNGMVLEEAVSLIKGDIGTFVILTIQREDVLEQIQFEINRAWIFPCLNIK